MKNIISHIKNITWTPKSLIFTFFAIILVRLTCEGWISRFAPRDMPFYFFETLHTTLFFGILFIMCIIILHKIALIRITTAITIMMFGYLLVIFPPIIDWIISITFFDGAHFMSYYLFDDAAGLLSRYVTFFGDQPHNGITYGTRIMIACALILITSTTYISTRNIFRTALACAITYTVFFFMSALPSLITFAINDAHVHASSAIVASEIASPTSFLNNTITNAFNAINIKMTMLYALAFLTLIIMIAHIFYRRISVSLWRNIRPIQSMYHIGLLVVGLCVAMIFNNAPLSIHLFSILAFVILCASIISAWYSTVIFNDIIDIEIDRISNRQRPLIEKVIDQETYRDIGYALFIISLTLMAMINMHAAAILLGYHAISFLYNTPPLRLKRFPFIATFLAAIASFFVVVIGYVVISPQHDITGFPPYIAILLIVAYTVSLPIKDLKDIDGDAHNTIYTIPVLLGEKYGRLMIAVGIFGSFMLSIVALNNWSLFWPAIGAGSLCFWSIVGTDKDGFVFGPHAVLRVIFVIVTIYGTILASSLLL